MDQCREKLYLMALVCGSVVYSAKWCYKVLLGSKI